MSSKKQPDSTDAAYLRKQKGGACIFKVDPTFSPSKDDAQRVFNESISEKSEFFGKDLSMRFSKIYGSDGWFSFSVVLMTGETSYKMFPDYTIQVIWEVILPNLQEILRPDCVQSTRTYACESAFTGKSFKEKTQSAINQFGKKYCGMMLNYKQGEHGLVITSTFRGVTPKVIHDIMDLLKDFKVVDGSKPVKSSPEHSKSNGCVGAQGCGFGFDVGDGGFSDTPPSTSAWKPIISGTAKGTGEVTCEKQPSTSGENGVSSPAHGEDVLKIYKLIQDWFQIKTKSTVFASEVGNVSAGNLYIAVPSLRAYLLENDMKLIVFGDA